jgi:hypothetical protein
MLKWFAILRRIDQSLLWGFAGTVIYSMIFLQPSMRDTTLGRYTTEHEVEYVIVAIFICGMVDVVLKLARLPREYLACHHEWLPPRVGREPPFSRVQFSTKSPKFGLLPKTVLQSP